jgi:hypothetical protein
MFQILPQSHAPLAVPVNLTTLPVQVLAWWSIAWAHKRPNRQQAVPRQGRKCSSSMADALLMIASGGLLSVMASPQTIRKEDCCVHAFLEASPSFFKPKQFGSLWLTPRCSDVRELKRDLQRESKRCCQTWEVHEHRKMGWIDAPILLTCIK